MADGVVRVLGLDPGSTTFGTAIMDIQLSRKKPTVIATETIDATKLFKPSENKAFIGARGVRDLRIFLIRRELKRIFLTHKPDVVIAEAPFLKRRNVSAFEALVEVRCMIRDLMWELDNTKTVIFVDPIRVKNYIGVSHIGTDKSDMYKAVHAYYDNKQKRKALVTADEHSIDAVAVCHVYYRREVLGDVVESTKKKRGRHAGKRAPKRTPRPKSDRRSGGLRSDRNGGSTPRRTTPTSNNRKGA